jgi:hypothetical protein
MARRSVLLPFLNDSQVDANETCAIAESGRLAERSNETLPHAQNRKRPLVGAGCVPTTWAVSRRPFASEGGSLVSSPFVLGCLSP